LLAKKHLRDLKRQGTKAFPFVFDESRAERFFIHFNSCVDPDSPFALDLNDGKLKQSCYKILPHQMFDFGMLYGWVYKDNGERKYTKVYKQEGKGNAKTTTCSIMAIYHIVYDKIYPPQEPHRGNIARNVWIDLMAVDKVQAEQLKDPIQKIIKATPSLRPLIENKRTYIECQRNCGKIFVQSKDDKNMQGGKPSVVIIDELSSHKDGGKRADIVEANLGKKSGVLLVIITTAGEDSLVNPAKKEYDQAMSILHAKLSYNPNEHYLPIIREMEESDDIFDTTLWQKANPMFRYVGQYKYADNWFKSVKRRFDAAYATENLQQQLRFKIFNANMWEERAANSFLNAKLLRRLNSKECKVSQEDFEKLTHGRPKIVGLDFSLRRDLTADADVFLLDDGRIAIDAHGYLLEAVVKEKEHSDKVPYRQYEKLGWCTIIPEEDALVIDDRVVANGLIERAKEKEQEIVEICYDGYQAGLMIQKMQDGTYASFDSTQCLEIKQIATIQHIPTTRLKKAIIDKQIVWNGNKLLLWCLQNCYEFMTKKGDLIFLNKEHKDSPRRIDLVAAIVNALARIDSLKDTSTSSLDFILSDEFTQLYG